MVINVYYLAHYCPFLVDVVASLSSPIMVAKVRVVVYAFGLYWALGVFGLEVGVL